MSLRRNALTLAATAVGLGVGVAAERSVLNRRRRTDPESSEAFGTRRGIRSRTLALPDGARIFIEESGPRARSGAVFVHGSALRTDVWHYQLNGINDHRLVFYDLRGHGLSQPKGGSEYNIETMSRDLSAVVADSGLNNVVVVGHSVGGMIALDFALRTLSDNGPEVKGLVLLNTTYAPAVETIVGGAALAHLERVTRRPFDFIGSQAQSIDRLRRIIRPSDAVFWTVAVAAFGPGASARQVDFAYDMLAETPADVIFDLIKSFREFDVGDRLEEVTAPALIVGGAHDRLTVSKASMHIAARLPNSRLELLDPCGHLSMLERHDDVTGMIHRFLDETLGRPGTPRRSSPTGSAAPSGSRKGSDFS
jgi:pimeloyl-ACP methyl ester carboxylesterase